MPPRLIVNADDFGLTRGINRAVEELCTAGVLSSATLMANGPAFDNAVAIATAQPTLGVGCHIVLTDGVPLSSPRTIPSLLGRDGRSFRPSLATFTAAALTGLLDPVEIRREAMAQIERLQAHGVRVTHLDTHKHTHIFPSVARALLEAAEHTGVPAIRSPFEQPWSLGLGHNNRKRNAEVQLIRLLKRRFLALPAIRSGAVRTTDGTVGISATGSLNQPALREIVDRLPDGTWELVCHPGYNDSDLATVKTRLRDTRDTERRALLSILARGDDPSPQAGPKFELIHYGQLT